MRILRGITSFFYPIIFSIFNLVYPASVDIFETLINLKIKHAEHIAKNNIIAICALGQEVINTSGIRQRSLAALIQRMQNLVPDNWLNWFKRTYTQDSIGYKDFAAAIFYPYEILEYTHKTHLSHMNYAFKASIMYSSLLDNSGAGRKFFNSLGAGTDLSITSATCCAMLDIGFITQSSSFMAKFIDYAESVGGLFQLSQDVLNQGTATQILNLGLIFKYIGENEKALKCFDQAIIMNSQRACIEKGNLLLKSNFNNGVEFFTTRLEEYGKWKVAQCYRYGINIKRDPQKANEHYLQAIGADCSKYPEILYDAADFAVEYAYAHLDCASEDDANSIPITSATAIYYKVMQKAITHFEQAGYFHLGLGYLKAAEMSFEVAKRTHNMPAILDIVRGYLNKAFMEGHVAKSDSILRKIKMDDDQQMIVMRGYVNNIDRHFADIDKH